jgi:hypothetical protein
MKQLPLTVTATAEGPWTRLRFRGPITEEAKPLLMGLLPSPQGKVLLDMGEVTFINSCGVRDWSLFLKSFREGREVALDRVTDDIVRTMNMVPNFHARLPVRSVFRAYACGRCGKEEQVQFVEGKDYQVGSVPTLSPQACEKCGSPSDPVESDDEFFHFLVV